MTALLFLDETKLRTGNTDGSFAARPLSDYTHLKDSCSHLYNTTSDQSEILFDNNNQSYTRPLHGDQSYNGSLSDDQSYSTTALANRSENVYSQLEAEQAEGQADGNMGKFYVPESGSDGGYRLTTLLVYK